MLRCVVTSTCCCAVTPAPPSLSSSNTWRKWRPAQYSAPDRELVQWDSPLTSPAPRSPRYVYKLLLRAVFSTGQGASAVGLYCLCLPLPAHQGMFISFYSAQYSAPDREPARWDSPLMSPAPRSPRYVYKLLLRAVFSTGQGASAVGLTAYVSRSPLTKVIL
jgi:hypothetical protein